MGEFYKNGKRRRRTKPQNRSEHTMFRLELSEHGLRTLARYALRLWRMSEDEPNQKGQCLHDVQGGREVLSSNLLDICTEADRLVANSFELI